MRIALQAIRLVIIAIIAAASIGYPVHAQENGGWRPIDMMILIDNSCSMFPLSRIPASCDAWGADPNYLRIVGADLFIARLGFAQANESEYQLGVISFGDAPEMISPLQPVTDRDALASKIANPRPQPATRLIPALQMAYDELKNSPNRNTAHLPAVVLITDGIPWPKEDQSNADIEQLISKHPEAPLFVMLLKDPNRPSQDYEDYIRFWESMQVKYPQVTVYQIENADQIQETYNEILGSLQNTIPTHGTTVTPGIPLQFTVGGYSQRVIITVIRNPGSTGGTVTVSDPLGNAVKKEDPGVVYFRGKVNPIEVYSIASPRLAAELKGQSWTVTATEPMMVIIDREGAYDIQFTSPKATAGDIANVFQATERQSLNQEFFLQFNLVDDLGNPVKDPQPVRGQAIAPDGTTKDLGVLANLQPDQSGAYIAGIDLRSIFPGLTDYSGKYHFVIDAGLVDEKVSDSPPIASAQIYVDFTTVPFIRSVAPSPLQCLPGQPLELRVSIGDLPAGMESQPLVKAASGDQTISLEPDGSGDYRADISALCQKAITTVPCGQDQVDTVTVQLEAIPIGDITFPALTQEVEMDVAAPACTATPLPTTRPTPTPTPIPLPDKDHDGLYDAIDRCPDTPGIPQANGCIPWNWLGEGLAGLAVLAFVGGWVWPWMKVRWVSPPPVAFVLICREGSPAAQPVAVQQVGRSKRTNRVTIGGSKRKANIYVEGLKPVELMVEWENTLVAMRDIEEKEPFAYFDEGVRIIRTSDPKVILKISLSPDQLKC
ncbi:MAG: VWA domain-containing protein [Chloroflexi bacterium]|nr:VWA domain-containing protein [Chloroflexota bacterium]